jgi:hypothetical protein
MVVALKAESLQEPSLNESNKTFVFLRPETSSFWNTAPGSSIILPIDYPYGATGASLSVSGLGYSRTYENVPEGDFKLELPAATTPREENIYELVLTFNNGVTRTARLGLIEGARADAQGYTRCIASKDDSKWGKIKKRAVLPIPYGVETFTIVKSDGTVKEDSTGLNGAQGWYLLKVSDSDRLTLSLTTASESYTQTILGIGEGFRVIVK